MTDHHIVAGGAGFIGLNLTRRLLSTSSTNVTILDNYSNSHVSAHDDLMRAYEPSGRLQSIKIDIAKYGDLERISRLIGNNCGGVANITLWHLAANSDIPSGIKDSSIDLKDTFMTTYNLIRFCKAFGLKKFIFASSSAIYGDHGEKPITESTGPLMPISNYGAMKLASEAICLAARHEFLDSLSIFRFPNVVGVPATHGVIYDFIQRLGQDSSCLKVLGNGTQKKSYLHVTDLVNAMILLSKTELNNGDNPIFNLGPSQDSITVREIAECVVAKIAPLAKISYGTTNCGWKGDIPKFKYNIEKATSYGWKPSLDSIGAVRLAVSEMADL